MTLINNALNYLLNSASGLKKAIDDAGVLDAKKAAASPTPTSAANSTNLSANDNLNYLSNNANTLLGKTSILQMPIPSIETRFKIAQLAALGISVNTTDAKTIANIKTTTDSKTGIVTVSGLNGSSTNPVTLTTTKVKGVNGITITNSSNVTVNADSATTSSTKIGTGCTNVLTATQRAASDAKSKIDLLKSYGVNVGVTDPSIINKMTISKDARGIVTISGLDSTPASLIPLSVTKANGVNGITITNSSNITVTTDANTANSTKINSNCFNVKTAAQRAAETTAAQKVAQLNSMGIILSIGYDTAKNADQINKISFSKDANGVVTVSGLSGSASEPVILSTIKRSGTNSIVIANSSNVTYGVPSAFPISAGSNCANVESLAERNRDQKVAELKALGITLNTSDPNIINRLGYTKNSATGVVSLTGVVGDENNPLQMTIVSANGVKGVSIDNSINVKVLTDSSTISSTKVGSNCYNVVLSNTKSATATKATATTLNVSAKLKK